MKLIPTLGLAILAMLAGCGKPATDTRPSRHPTHGTVTYNGQPARGAVVTLWPLPLENNNWRTVKPAGEVGADGTYRLNTHTPEDGAVAGEYAVTVVWAGDNHQPGPDRLMGRYADPKKATVKVTIKEGDNEIPPLTLTGPALSSLPKAAP